jgi:hypothetical protein
MPKGFKCDSCGEFEEDTFDRGAELTLHTGGYSTTNKAYQTTEVIVCNRCSKKLLDMIQDRDLSEVKNA